MSDAAYAADRDFRYLHETVLPDGPSVCQYDSRPLHYTGIDVYDIHSGEDGTSDRDVDVLCISAFYDFYESKNWYVGKNKMKDWKACVRTWEQRQSTPKKESLFL